MIRFTTAGESHGEVLVVVIEGIPAGLTINLEDINIDLARRQRGYGRGKRMLIETDIIKVLSGIRHGRTLGSPITMSIANKDFESWMQVMSPVSSSSSVGVSLLRPRPGHADLSGLMKYGVNDFRDILERASARETAARVAVGAVCKMLLKKFGIIVMSYTLQIGSIVANMFSIAENEVQQLAEMSYVRCPDAVASKKMIELINEVSINGDTLGGKIVVIAKNVLVGLGSHTQWDLKLDGRIAQSLISIQAVKAVEFGAGSNLAECFGSVSHDEIFYSETKGFYRRTNRAGGIEGGMSNGEPIVVTCTMKAIPSLANPLRSVNIVTKEAETAELVRSDICAVPALAVVAEAAVAIELSKALSEKFGSDCLKDMENSFNMYKERLGAL
ncbi:MAG: chorismate synthase [Endomicrobium sp.]|nr:chorismate synthase [Endomicrobium sp.]